MLMHLRSTESAPAAATGEWYNIPVVWLGMVLFAASLAGCVLMIVLGARHVDAALPTAGGEIMKMPLARPATSDKP